LFAVRKACLIHFPRNAFLHRRPFIFKTLALRTFIPVFFFIIFEIANIIPVFPVRPKTPLRLAVRYYRLHAPLIARPKVFLAVIIGISKYRYLFAFFSLSSRAFHVFRVPVKHFRQIFCLIRIAERLRTRYYLAFLVCYRYPYISLDKPLGTVDHRAFIVRHVRLDFFPVTPFFLPHLFQKIPYLFYLAV